MRGFLFFYRMKILANFKLNWAIQPLSRFLVVYFIGLLVSYYLLINFWILLASILCVLGKLLFLLQFRINRRAKFTGFSVFSIILLTGALHGLSYHSSKETLGNDLIFDKQFYFIRINSEPILKDSSISFYASYFQVDSSCKKFQGVDIQVKTTIYSTSDSFRIGEFLLVHAKLSDPQKAQLPGEFNYQDYLKRIGIEAITSFQSSAYLKLGVSDFSIKQHFIQTRNRLIKSLAENGLRNDELAIASALLLGARSDISEELNDAYSQSGITHILAVSGMHVGLVFTAISFLLKRIRNKYVVCFLSVGFLWSYACLTGLSASVTRAAWMFSFIALGNLFRSGHQKWNSIAASALLMLVLDPFIWLDAGFQLSFAAVWGIVSLGKLPEKFQRLPKWLKLPAEAAWVSCVAQLFTLPVSLLIFGKFPVYFLLANLVTVPLSTLLTYWGIITLIVLPFPAVAKLFCQVLSLGIQGMNLIPLEISKLPFSTFADLYLNIVQASCLAIVLYMCSAKFLSWKEKFRWALFFCCLGSSILWIQLLSSKSPSVFIYSSSKAIGIIEHSENAANIYFLKSDTFQSSYANKSLNAFKKFAIQNQLPFQSVYPKSSLNWLHGFKINSSLLFSSTVFFINPENLRVNPFSININFRSSDTVVLMAGGKPKKRQLWRLALQRSKAQIIDAQSNRLVVQSLK